MMRNRIGLAIILALLGACNKGEPAPEVCSAKLAEQRLSKEYKEKGYAAEIVGGQVVLTKRIVARDGQAIGYERHTFAVDASSDATRTDCASEVLSERQIGLDKLVCNHVDRWARFWHGADLVYTDTGLRDENTWLRKYERLTDIAVEVPNVSRKDGQDLYMTWIARSEDTASRIPIWGYEVVWSGPTESPTLMGGKVVMKNPEREPQSDETFTVIRLDAEGVVNERGVLFPASPATWVAYLAFQQGRVTEWQRDISGDQAAFEAYLVGAARTIHKREKALVDVYALRNTQVQQLPKVKPGFKPGFGAIKPLAEQKR